MAVSNDGGATWSKVYGEVSGAVDLAWTEHTVTLGADYAVHNFRIRFIFRSDSTVTAPAGAGAQLLNAQEAPEPETAPDAAPAEAVPDTAACTDAAADPGRPLNPAL